MSALGLKPSFKDETGYRHWRHQWRVLYKEMTIDIRRSKMKVNNNQRAGIVDLQQKHLGYQRAMASKMMGLLQEAKNRWKRILSMKQQIAEQMASFPLIMEDCRHLDFHYNKGNQEFPDLPMWVVKTKGRVFYLHHITALCPWSTKETPDGSTRGMIRFKNCILSIDKNAEATITQST